MAGSSMSEAKTAHVNLMTDTIIANLPPDGLRSVVRAILTTNPGITSALEHHTQEYLTKTKYQLSDVPLFSHNSGKQLQVTDAFRLAQQRIRTMLGCGLCYESLTSFTNIVRQSSELNTHDESLSDDLLNSLASLDGDIVQMLTAIQKSLQIPGGTRDFSSSELEDLQDLHQALTVCREKCRKSGQGFYFGRSLASMPEPFCSLPDQEEEPSLPVELESSDIDGYSATVETFRLGERDLPRLFSGLWQLSSPSWGVASQSNIFKQFSAYARKGFTAFDMADHYGDAEVIFGNFRSISKRSDIFGATKYCVFQPITITPEVISKNVTERCTRLQSDSIDLLQFHWQFYNDPQYIKALQLLQEDGRVRALGLCNFDTPRLEEIVNSGIKVRTNQVQFSLIDLRPTFKMGEVCQQHDVKLLTYGTLCGGFIAEKWLGQPEPELFGNDITPSQRKYYEMILIWGGWALFQELLEVLKSIAMKHDVKISNVATRWVLDFPYVGAVILGARMGISGHADDNRATYGWQLDAEDRDAVQGILGSSRSKDMFEAMGDCGGEYR